MAGKLEPEYIQKLPLTDTWGNEIQYFCLPPGHDYWIISFGQDHIQDEGIYDSYGVPSAAGKGIVHDFDSDLIYKSGVSFRYPEGHQKGALQSIDEAAAGQREKRQQQREEEIGKKEADRLTSLSKRFPLVESLKICIRGFNQRRPLCRLLILLGTQRRTKGSTMYLQFR